MRTVPLASSQTSPAEALRRAVEAAQGQTGLARICGCTQGAISQMLKKAEPKLSVQYVLKVEAALGIPRHLLRPDVYPDPALETTTHAHAA